MRWRNSPVEITSLGRYFSCQLFDSQKYLKNSNTQQQKMASELVSGEEKGIPIKHLEFDNCTVAM